MKNKCAQCGTSETLPYTVDRADIERGATPEAIKICGACEDYYFPEE